MAFIEPPWSLSILGGVAAAAAGIAALLRSGKPPRTIAIASSGLNSGLLGSALVLCCYSYVEPTATFTLVGLATVAGLCGPSLHERAIPVLVDAVISILRSFKRNGNGDKAP